MKYGCCVNLLPKSDGVGLEYAPRLKAMGYDYIELPLNELAKLSGAEFDAAVAVLRELDLPCRCCNDFMPSVYQIVGEEVTPREELLDYLRLAMGRVERLGASYAVFGSPWSRGCPQGFDRERGFEQIADFLRMAADEAARHNVTIVIEHNNHTETNMLNHFSDGVRMARAVDHPNVKVLCDYYHLRFEGDEPEMLLDGGELLRHTHFAQLEERAYLTDLGKEPMLPRYAEVLRRIGYDGGVSVEARVKDSRVWERAARLNLENLKKTFG